MMGLDDDVARRAQAHAAPIVGAVKDDSVKPFACPSCGGSQFTAYYDVPASQLCELVVDDSCKQGDDGGQIPYAETYLGDERIDGDPGPDLEYRCLNCGWLVAVA